MAASTKTAANADDHKTALNHQLIDSLKAELDKVKTDLNDELDKLEKAKADIGAFWQQREVRRPKL